MQEQRLLQSMVSRLQEALDGALNAVVLYGPGARGEIGAHKGQLNLLIVTSDLEPETLKVLSSPVRWWLGKDQPWPRLFSRALIGDSLDVFPVEFLDLSHHRKLLYGEDPLSNIRVDESHLRVQCERELREKLMRLREGYVECAGAGRALHQLMTASYTSYAPLWRACLYLMGCEVPADDSEAASYLSRQLRITSTAFEEVALLVAGAHTEEPEALFARYLHQLSDTVACIDQLAIKGKGVSS